MASSDMMCPPRPPDGARAPAGTRAHARRLLGAACSLAMLTSGVSCAPRLRPLAGAPAPARLPSGRLAAGHQRVVFRWELEEDGRVTRGEGAARIAAPDSARLDFFLGGGYGGGAAILIGDSLAAPGGENVQRLVPPAPLLWASLGRLALPPLPDTVARVDGHSLIADIGHPTAWRVTFRDDTLMRIDHVVGGRVVEWVQRDGEQLRYRNERARRTLMLNIVRRDEVPPFDASIWSLP